MSIPSAILNTGAKIPMIGLGTWKSGPGEVKQAVMTALKNGYRHIDCAMAYNNECEVGEAFKECFPTVCKREDVFVTTKLWMSDFDPADVEVALNCSLKRLGLDYIDLYLVHWPVKVILKGPKRDPNDYKNWFTGLGADKDVLPYSIDWFLPTWTALEKCVEKGLTRAIGLSNFSPKRIDSLLQVCKIKPAMLQIELHPGLSQVDTLNYCATHNISVTGYSPLGSPDRPDVFKNAKHFVPLSDPCVLSIAQKYNKSSAQVLLRWGIQRNTIVIPKSVNAKRIAENINIFDFALSDEDMEQINRLNTNNRIFVAPSFYTDPELVKQMWE